MAKVEIKPVGMMPPSMGKASKPSMSGGGKSPIKPVGMPLSTHKASGISGGKKSVNIKSPVKTTGK